LLIARLPIFSNSMRLKCTAEQVPASANLHDTTQLL
jgi:hypothetical protein